MGTKYKQTDDARARVVDAAKIIVAAEQIFLPLRRYRDAHAAWAQAVAAFGSAESVPSRVKTMSDVALAAAEYIEAATAAMPIVPERTRALIDEAVRHVTAFVLEGQHYGSADPPMASMMILAAYPNERGVPRHSLADYAWGAALSFVSWIEVIDSQRAAELADMKLADVVEARRLATDDRGVHRGFNDKRKKDSDAATANRRAMREKLAAWLATQPAHVIEANERLHTAGDPNAITLAWRAPTRPNPR